MSQTLHKILIHGATVISHVIVPIGQLSEEAAEARNKHFRLYRQNFSRKCSREACNNDVLKRLLLSSDPYLSSIRPKPQKKVCLFQVKHNMLYFIHVSCYRPTTVRQKMISFLPRISLIIIWIQNIFKTKKSFSKLLALHFTRVALFKFTVRVQTLWSC